LVDIGRWSNSSLLWVSMSVSMKKTLYLKWWLWNWAQSCLTNHKMIFHHHELIFIAILYFNSSLLWNYTIVKLIVSENLNYQIYLQGRNETCYRGATLLFSVHLFFFKTCQVVRTHVYAFWGEAL
jgi:hypothetical protein